jgi:DNA modification methylase
MLNVLQKNQVQDYLEEKNISPLFIHGDSDTLLTDIPPNSIDCIITSPPYWSKRKYKEGGIGLENSKAEYIKGLLSITSKLKIALKDEGSFWLNIGDTFRKKSLQGIPWRIALKMIDEQGWTLRNNIIWNKIKGGPDNSTDRLRTIHENVFHFVKEPNGYYYNIDSVRSDPRKSKVVNGSIVTATGVSGVRYKRQIELSTSLLDEEKENALKSLNEMLNKVKNGEIGDFRMIIRDQQRTTHSNSTEVSGRAKQLQNEGFYFLKYNPKGSKPSDMWEIIPEDTQNRTVHFAPFPEDLCKIPIKTTCPDNGVVLDPFCGTGTAMLVAKKFGKKSIGLDISKQYLALANERCNSILL